MVKPDLGTQFFRQKRKSTHYGKDISNETTPDHLMMSQWQLHTVSLETCMSGKGLTIGHQHHDL